MPSYSNPYADPNNYGSEFGSIGAASGAMNPDQPPPNYSDPAYGSMTGGAPIQGYEDVNLNMSGSNLMGSGSWGMGSPSTPLGDLSGNPYDLGMGGTGYLGASGGVPLTTPEFHDYMRRPIAQGNVGAIRSLTGHAYLPMSDAFKYDPSSFQSDADRNIAAGQAGVDPARAASYQSRDLQGAAAAGMGQMDPMAGGMIRSFGGAQQAAIRSGAQMGQMDPMALNAYAAADRARLSAGRAGGQLEFMDPMARAAYGDAYGTRGGAVGSAYGLGQSYSPADLMYGQAAGLGGAAGGIAGQILNGPSAVDAAHQASVDRQRAMLASASASGPFNPASAIAAQKAAAGVGQDLSAQYAANRAQEQLGKQQAAAGILGGLRGQELDAAGQRQLAAQGRAGTQAGMLSQLYGQDLGAAGQLSADQLARRTAQADIFGQMQARDLAAAGQLDQQALSRLAAQGSLYGDVAARNLAASGQLDQNALARQAAEAGVYGQMRGQDVNLLGAELGARAQSEALGAQYAGMDTAERQFQYNQQQELERMMADISQRERDRQLGVATHNAYANSGTGGTLGNIFGTLGGLGLSAAMMFGGSDRRMKTGVLPADEGWDEDDGRGIMQDIADGLIGDPYSGAYIGAGQEKADWLDSLAASRPSPAVPTPSPSRQNLDPVSLAGRAAPAPGGPGARAWASGLRGDLVAGADPGMSMRDKLMFGGMLANSLGGLGQQIGSLADGPRVKKIDYPSLKVVSDRRAKRNARGEGPLSSFLDHLNPYSYEYKDPALPGALPGRQVGVMAQDVERGGPIGQQMVMDDPRTGYKALNFDPRKFNPLVLASLGQLNERLERLERG